MRRLEEVQHAGFAKRLNGKSFYAILRSTFQSGGILEGSARSTGMPRPNRSQDHDQINKYIDTNEFRIKSSGNPGQVKYTAIQRLIALSLFMALSGMVNSAGPSGWDCQEEADGRWTCKEPVLPPRPEGLLIRQAGETAPGPVLTRPADQPPPPMQQPERKREAEDASAPATQPPAPQTRDTVNLLPADSAAGEARATEIVDTAESLGITESVDEDLEEKVSPWIPENWRGGEAEELTLVPVESTWERGLCPPEAGRLLRTDEIGDPEEVPTQLYADEATSRDDEIYELQGRALVQRGEQLLSAENITYNTTTEVMEAHGQVVYEEPSIALEGSSARLHVASEEGEMQDVNYRWFEKNARGEAETIYMEGPGHKRLMRASYTTCAPGNNDWKLVARQVKMDEFDGLGKARDVRIEMAGVPVFYTPYLRFPLDDRRKSGFLIPKVGSTVETGLDLRTPYYWNMAPNRDATITPRFMGKRGVQLGGEFRYLYPRVRGKIGAEYLPDDKETGENRSLYTIRQSGNPFPGMQTSIHASQVSDKDYFTDFGDNLAVASITHLRQEAGVNYHGGWWSIKTRVQNFQTVDPTIPGRNRPYKRLPEIKFRANPGFDTFGIRYSLGTDLSHFEQDDRVTGTRIDLYPRVYLPLRKASWYATPSLTLSHTHYNLSGTGSGNKENPDRTAPIASLDTGVFFDRNTSLFSRNYVQTLEPRLYYLYVPNKNQDDLPVFDTGNYDFNFWQLFNNNRFSGPDRLGDANQLALAATTRLLDPNTGKEKLRLSLGNLIYFRDRKVTLPGETVENDTSSDLVAEMTTSLSNHVTMGGTFLWDPNENKTERGTIRLQYSPKSRSILNLSYRFRRSTLRQADVSFIWPLTPAWHVIGRYYYSFKDSEKLEAMAGIEYDSCCWAFRIVGRSFVNGADSGNNDAIYMQLVLKGLMQLGDQVEDILEDTIVGYN